MRAARHGITATHPRPLQDSPTTWQVQVTNPHVRCASVHTRAAALGSRGRAGRRAGWVRLRNVEPAPRNSSDLMESEINRADATLKANASRLAP